MTQAYNLSQLANNLNTTGQLDATDGLVNAVPVANGGTGAAAFTANNVLLGNGASSFQTVAPGVAGNVLTSNGTTWASASGGFATGTVMLFVQTAAPTGWTKSTTHDNKALRVVSGTAASGGTTAFTSVFANQTPTITLSGLSAGATTLSTAQIPSHTHGYIISTDVAASTGLAEVRGSAATVYPNAKNTAATGGGGSHTHTVSGSGSSSAITLNVAYVDVIIATKN
jgi:hypothetical protein